MGSLGFSLLAKFRSVTQQNKSLFQFQGIAESSNVKDINVCAKNPCCADLKFLKEVAVRMTTVVFIFIFCLARSFCDLHIFGAAIVKQVTFTELL